MSGGDERLPTILIVDDDPMVTSAISRLVKRLGHRALAVNDPHQALEVLAHEPVDLLITDKDMPGMSGHELIERIKDGHREVPCVMLTGVPSLESAMSAINSEQVIRYLTKPWAPHELEETVAAGLDRRAMWLQAASSRRAEAERGALRAELYARDPELAALSAGDVVIVPGPLAEQLDDLVRRLLDDDGLAREYAARLIDVAAAARASELADALAIVAVRHPTAGVLLWPLSRARSRLELDARTGVFPLLDIDRELGDVVAARLALLAGIDPATTAERLGRFAVTIPGAGGQLIVGYRRATDGATLEVRRLLSGADAVAPASTPQQIAGYTLLEQIGQGGMGTVYRAVHGLLGRPAAVKVLRGAYSDDAITVARFMREARAATRAHHPRIVETYDFGHLPDGRPYLVMELVESPTLQQRLKRGALDPLEAVLIARDVAEALAAAHRVGVVHRDLKPGNIFVDDQLNVKLCDFGAAKLLDAAAEALTRDGWTVGTPSYMSPEHIIGKHLDGRADLYALGCVLFEMLSGKPPYRGDSRAVLAQHLQVDVPAPVSPMGALPPGLVRLVKKAMAKDRRQRHADADLMMSDLDAIAEELSRERGARRP